MNLPKLCTYVPKSKTRPGPPGELAKDADDDDGDDDHPLPPLPFPEDQTKAIFEGGRVEHLPERDLLLQLLPSHEEDRVDEREQDAERRRRHDSDQAQILDVNMAVVQK